MMSSHEAVGVESSQNWNMSIFQCLTPPWGLDVLISRSFRTVTPRATPNVYQSSISLSSARFSWAVGSGVSVKKKNHFKHSRRNHGPRHGFVSARPNVKNLLSDILVEEQNSDYTVSRRTNRGGRGEAARLARRLEES